MDLTNDEILRDQFAGQAMMSLLMNEKARDLCTRCGRPENGAERAYHIAISMMRVRARILMEERLEVEQLAGLKGKIDDDTE